MKAFICSVKSYLELSSRDCIVTSDKRIPLLHVFGGWFRNPPKQQKLVEKVFGKTSFQVGMELKKYLNKAEMRNLKNRTLLQNHAGPFFDLQRNPLASLVRFVV